MGISRVSFVSTPLHLQKSAKTKSMLWTFEDETEDVPDDNKIRREVTGLRLAIFKHAHSYYSQEPARCTVPELVDIFAGIALEFPSYSATEFAHLLCDISTRSSTIKSFIAYMVTKKMDFSSSSKDTLLQPSIVDCIGDFGFGNSQVKLNKADENLFAQWRMLSAHFVSRALKAENVKDNEENSFENNVLEIDKILNIFATSEKDNPKRLKSMAAIFSKGREIGKLMFASPSRWRFDWKPPQSNVGQDPEQPDKHAKRSKEQRQYRAIDSKGRPVILICFPGLEQRFTQSVKNNDVLVEKRRRGEYDDGSEIRRVLRPVRRRTMDSVDDKDVVPESVEIIPAEKSDDA